MRILTWALACTLGGALGVTLADEPTKAPAPNAVSTPAATAPAPSTAPAATSTPAAKADINDEMLEKHFRSEGYKVEVRNGEKWYCKSMTETGTRLSSAKPVCSPGELLYIKEKQQRDDLEKAQRTQIGSKGG
jgi:hypothetical protein